MGVQSLTEMKTTGGGGRVLSPLASKAALVMMAIAAVTSPPCYLHSSSIGTSCLLSFYVLLSFVVKPRVV